MTAPEPAAVRRPGWEVLLVLGVSLGQSAVYSMLSIAEKLTRAVPLGQQTTQINTSVTPDRPWLDLAYQLAGIAFPLVPAILALYLLRLSGDRHRIGFDLARPGRDLAWGFAIAAGIGIPGLGLYLVSRAAGLNTTVQPANLAAQWWTVPVLIGLAIMNGVLEEVVIVAFWFTRMTQRGWPVAAWCTWAPRRRSTPSSWRGRSRPRVVATSKHRCPARAGRRNTVHWSAWWPARRPTSTRSCRCSRPCAGA